MGDSEGGDSGGTPRGHVVLEETEVVVFVVVHHFGPGTVVRG